MIEYYGILKINSSIATLSTRIWIGELKCVLMNRLMSTKPP